MEDLANAVELRARYWDEAAEQMERVVRSLGGWTSQLEPDARDLAALAELLRHAGPVLDGHATDSIELGVAELFRSRGNLQDHLTDARAAHRKISRLEKTVESAKTTPTAPPHAWATEDDRKAQVRQTAYLEKKTIKYTHEAETLVRRKGTKALNPQVDQNSALHLAQQAKQVRIRLEESKRLLAAYEDLPQDLHLARFKLGQTKERVARLDLEIARPRGNSKDTLPKK